MTQMEKEKPRWIERDRHIPHRPNWVDKIPHELYTLGKVFFPIPRGKKAWRYLHHLKENRFEPDDRTLNAYLEQGWGYGIACANSLAVVDIDEKDKVREVAEKLPETAYQVTGSREGVHLIYQCPGLNSREILYYPTEKHDCDTDGHKCGFDEDGECSKDYEWEHLGEVKCDPHGYIIGPGSVHPSGNTYGPLQGGSIAEVSKDELLDALSDYMKPDYNTGNWKYEEDRSFTASGSRYAFYQIDANDLFPWLGADERISHPTHGSSSGSNFMKNSDGQTFTCWRHNDGGGPGCGLSAQQVLAQLRAEKVGAEYSDDCELVKAHWSRSPILHYYAWVEALEEGLVDRDAVPYKVLLGFAKRRTFTTGDSFSAGGYQFAYNALQYELDWGRAHD